MISVAWGISETRKLFGRPSILQNAYQWLKQFPPFHRKLIAGSINVAITPSISMRAYVWSKTPPDATIDEKLQAIEKNIERLQESTMELETKLDNEVHSREVMLKEERNLRERAENDIRTKLETTETGGLNLSLIGIVWLIFGLFLATIPTEIIRIFR